MGLKAVHVVSGKGQSCLFSVNILCRNFNFDTLVHTLNISLVVNMHKISVSGMHYVQTFVYRF